MPAIEIQGLRKEYRRFRGGTTVALDGLDLNVESGHVFGFLGPNGSGKTTTIRCLLGLSRPTSGSARILGYDTSVDLDQVIHRVGSLVEAPALFPTFTARRNLELLAQLHDLPARRIDAVIEQVGLKGRERDLVKTYSLGMRQRLGIAAALLKEPDVLILDEPANGLDPAGIREVRQLLRRIAIEGVTVLVSSHILSEVQQTCDTVAIISEGRCVTQGPVAEVLQRASGTSIVLKVEHPTRALQMLQLRGFAAHLDDGAIVVDIDPVQAADVSRTLADGGLFPYELRPTDTDLETVFLQLTGKEVAA